VRLLALNRGALFHDAFEVRPLASLRRCLQLVFMGVNVNHATCPGLAHAAVRERARGAGADGEGCLSPVAGTKAELRHLARGTCDRARLAVNYKISLGQTLTNRPGGGSGLGGAPERSTLESLAMATYKPLWAPTSTTTIANALTGALISICRCQQTRSWALGRSSAVPGWAA
jgi:hypothetical protein